MKGLVFVLVAFLAPIAVQCRAGVQRSSVSAGSCPYQRPSVKDCQQGLFFAEYELPECFDDEECVSSLKCCQRKCEMKCVAPVHYNKWCKAPVDLGIMFDTQSNDLGTVKKMIIKTLNLSVSSGATHIALMPIEKDSELLLKFDGKQNRTEILKIIKNMHTGPQRQTGKLSTALRLAKDMFNETNGGRPDAIKVLLVITDANVDENDGHLKAASQDLRKAGILVQTVGVTKEMSLMHLVEIATSDVYVWPDVSADMLKELKKLEEEPCQ